MEKKIITISREFGAGGRTVGHMVADKLGIPFYDGKLVEDIAKESGFAPKFVEEHSEHSPSGSVFSYAFAPQGVPGIMNGLSTADYLWNAQCNVILELAEKGPCVIVGRCADYILQDKADCLKVFIHADMAFRAHRIVEVYGERDQSPEERLKDKDKRRAAYHRFYTDMKWGHAQNYHITLNSGVLGIDKCVDILAQLF